MSHLSWYFRTWLHWDKASSPQCLLSFIKMMEELLWNGNRDHNMGTILTLQADATLKQTAKKNHKSCCMWTEKRSMEFFVSMTNASIKACNSLVKPRIHYLSVFCIIYNTLIACETYGHFSQGVFQIEEHLTLENTIITRLNLSKPLWLQRLKCELLVVFHIQLRAEWGLNP